MAKDCAPLDTVWPDILTTMSTHLHSIIHNADLVSRDTMAVLTRMIVLSNQVRDRLFADDELAIVLDRWTSDVAAYHTAYENDPVRKPELKEPVFHDVVARDALPGLASLLECVAFMSEKDV